MSSPSKLVQSYCYCLLIGSGPLISPRAVSKLRMSSAVALAYAAHAMAKWEKIIRRAPALGVAESAVEGMPEASFGFSQSPEKMYSSKYKKQDRNDVRTYKYVIKEERAKSRSAPIQKQLQRN